MALRAGTVFQPADRDRESHLWVVLSDSEEHPYAPVLIVNFTSWRSDKDDACILHRSDHPRIRRKTCANYRYSKLAPIEKLEEAMARGLLIQRQPVSPEVLARLREGAARSRLIPLANLQLLKDQGLVD